MAEDGQVDAGAVREMLDRAAIRDVIERYFVCLDRKTPQGMADVFAPDATISYFGGKSRRSAADVIAGGPLPFTWSSHTLSNIGISFDGGRASADTYAVAFLAFAGRDGGAGRLLVRGLQYLDVLARGPEGWRILDREHIGLWESQADLNEPSSAEALRALGGGSG